MALVYSTVRSEHFSEETVGKTAFGGDVSGFEGREFRQGLLYPGGLPGDGKFENQRNSILRREKPARGCTG